MRKNISRTGGTNGKLVPRLVASLLCGFIVGVGFRAVLSAHYFARSGKLGMEITLDGPAAVAIGICIIFLGGLPLTVWFSSRRAKMVWAILCIIAATVSYYVSTSLQHI